MARMFPWKKRKKKSPKPADPETASPMAIVKETPLPTPQVKPRPKIPPRPKGAPPPEDCVFEGRTRIPGTGKKEGWIFKLKKDHRKILIPDD